jgi:D-inositol-3-phosphate glycosyltransferase
MRWGVTWFAVPVQRVAVLSLHTSPLLQPGAGDSGGMNVYVRELVSALAHAGLECTTYTRATSDAAPGEVHVEPGHRVVHVRAGEPGLPKERLAEVVDEFADGVAAHLRANGGADVLHANYWLSGLAGHRLKHELGIPLVTTFHTLARVKAEGGDPEPTGRERSELDVMGCADAICVSCTEEERQLVRLHGTPPGRIEIVAPGVEHAFFAPGERRGAREALGFGSEPVIVFAGRIQPLKGLDVAVEALGAMHSRGARLVAIGGASGTDGNRELDRVRRLVADLGLAHRVDFVPPQPHHLLSSYYRAADAVVVPSRSESFGLVALEAAACGTPVVASAVGGLLTIVDHGVTGFLVPDRDPIDFARYLDRLIEEPSLAGGLGRAAAERARRYTWSFAAARLRRVYADVVSRDRVECR